MILATLLVMAGCNAQKVKDGEWPFYGKWKVGDAIEVGNAIIPIAISQEEKRKMIGSIVEYSPNEVRYRGMILRNPVYDVRLLQSEDEWPLPQIMDPEGFKPIGRVNYAMLGFKSPVGVWYVEVLERREDGTLEEWTYGEKPDDEPCPAEPVTSFFVDANGTVVFYGSSGFYRAERVK